jgi:uncharacterized protein YqeY
MVCTTLIDVIAKPNQSNAGKRTNGVTKMSSLKDQLKSDLTNAMKLRNEVETSTLRMTLAAVMNAEVAGAEAVELTNEQVLTVISAEAKKRAESADIYKEAGRHEAEAAERAELAILERYLPAQISDADLVKIVDLAIAEAAKQGLIGPKAMGAVVKVVRAHVGSSADGAKIANLVKSKLV